MGASNISVKSGKIEVSINPKIYPVDIVYSAAYVFLDKAYVLLKGDPKKEIIAELIPKAAMNSLQMEEFGMEFNSQLLNYATYKDYSNKNIEVKKMIMHEIFTSLGADSIPAKDIDDPEGILIPWEEKYGKKQNNGWKKRKA
jgi:His-Xaa-Ser system protein HxsD